MSEPKPTTWIVRSIDPGDPEPYVCDPDCDPTIWAPWQKDAHPFTSSAAAHDARHEIGGEHLRVFRLVPHRWAPWSEAHVKAAKIECFRWATEEVEIGSDARADWMITIGQLYTKSETAFLQELAALLPTQQERDRFRRRIENRAAGREQVAPVEEFFRVRLRNGLYVPEQGDDHEAGVGPGEAHESERGTHMDQLAAGISGSRLVTVRLKRRRTIS